MKDALVDSLLDTQGKLFQSKKIENGSTIAYFEVQTLYNGLYIVKMENDNGSFSQKVNINR